MEDLSKQIAPLVPLLFAFSILSSILINWITGLYLLIFRPTIKLFPAGAIEIGFGSFGPSITLGGTLLAERGDFFITSMELTVQRRGGNIAHRMEWGAFKPQYVGLEADDNATYEFVAAFALKKELPFKYNIVFTDDAFVHAETQAAKQIRDDYQAYIEESHYAPEDSGWRESFYQRPNIQAIAGAWKQKVYWKPGDYELHLSILSTRKPQRFSFCFHLSETDCIALQSNVRGLIFFVCGEKVRYAKVYTKYQTQNSLSANTKEDRTVRA